MKKILKTIKKIPYQYPDPSGTERSTASKEFRDLATEVARLRPHASTRNNGEETDHGPVFPANFTKGLAHDDNGVLMNKDGAHYSCFVEAINSRDRTLFEKQVETAATQNVDYKCLIKKDKKLEKPEWRGWESPRAGHVYELEGPDSGSVGMSPAPRVGSSELAAEMAEVYAMALLRDVPFTLIQNNKKKKLCKNGGQSLLSPQQIATALNSMPFYNGINVTSSEVTTAGEDGYNKFEENRRYGRNQSNPPSPITVGQLFRGSTPGALEGPYISQFMLAGSTGKGGPVPGGSPSFPGVQSKFDPEDGFIVYGTQIIDQRVAVHKECLDYMTDWPSWLDVQNGANFKNLDLFEDERRFITTPRDLATYVHFDALYQAYLNACLILLGSGAELSKGFPEPSFRGRRDAFATFGGPHILSLVTEVATRCLKSVRRQKFNYHRRGRPEVIGGRLTLTCLGGAEELGCGGHFFEKTLEDIPKKIKDAIIAHNKTQNTAAMRQMRRLKCPTDIFPLGQSATKFDKCNLLLPMAFPEGSPMHPAYGAGHATVAGGCVTMLKAFFEMFDSKETDGLKPLDLGPGVGTYYEPNATGKKLQDAGVKRLTIQGELDKLAANISIGRNMAGVHYYSDYYDSLRMGERIAVGILMEQAPTYQDEMEMSFNSFDGDLITIAGEAGTCPMLTVRDREGDSVSPRDWWLRHVPGEEIILDF